jgi:hypothetical protein
MTKVVWGELRYWLGRGWPVIERLFWALLLSIAARTIMLYHDAPVWAGDAVAIWVGLSHLRFTATRNIIAIPWDS